MIKIIHKSKVLRIVIIVLIITLICCYRAISRNILKTDTIQVEIEPCGMVGVGDISESKVKEINGNVNNYAYITYSFYATNESDNVTIYSMAVNPIFSDKMKEHVYWYSHSDMLNDAAEHLNPHQKKFYYRLILVKRDGLSDEEFIDMAKKDSIKINYKTYKKIPILTYWYSSVNVKVEQKEY